MRTLLALALAAFAFVAPAAAQQFMDVPAAPVDTSQFATTAALSVVQAAMPQPSAIIPPTDTNTGAIGSSPAYARADSIRPRITRSMSVTLASDGTAMADWTTHGGALSAAAIVVLTPIYASTTGNAPKCWLTGAPTTTAAAIKCVLENASALSLNLSIITAGLNLNGASASGMVVNVQAYPPS